MSLEVEMLSKEGIDQEYTKCCMALGDISYKIEVLKNDAYKIKTKMAELNKHAAGLQSEEE